jgi:hypothetical protein
MFVVIESSQVHPTHVSTLSGSGRCPYPAGYAEQAAEEPTVESQVPVAFQPPALASWVVLRPLGNRAFLTVGLPDTDPGPDPIGVVTFRMSEQRSGRAPP